jgi:hypothetical protein
VFCEHSRWFAEFTSVRLRREAGLTTAALPVRPRQCDIAANCVNYVTKYVTKEDAPGANVKAVGLLELLTATRAAGDRAPDAENDARLGKRAVSRIANAMHGTQLYPAVLAARMLLGYDDSYISHDFVPFCPTPFVKALVRLQPGDAEAVAHDATASGARPFVNALDDYMARPPELAHLPPFFFFAAFRKAPKDQYFDNGESEARRNRRGLPRFPMDGDHPQSETHMFIGKSAAQVPYLVADAPVRPSEDADDDVKDAYAAFALGVFTTAVDKVRRARGAWVPAGSLASHRWAPLFLEWLPRRHDGCDDVGGVDVAVPGMPGRHCHRGNRPCHHDAACRTVRVHAGGRHPAGFGQAVEALEALGGGGSCRRARACGSG